MDNIQRLTQFGLTRQEALIYTILLEANGLTGYEVSKKTGISRSNAYTALAGLAEKGAAHIIEGTSKKYIALSPEEFCSGRIETLKRLKASLMQTLSTKAAESDGYITICGRENIINKMSEMVKGAQKRVYVSANEETLRFIEGELLKAAESIKVVIITDGTVNFENATLYRSSKIARQLRIIADSKYVLTGDIYKSDSSALYSSKSDLAELIKDSIRNEIKLFELKKEK